MARNIITGIDIGSSAIRIVVLETTGGLAESHILALTKSESRGLRRGHIVNPDEIAECVSRALAKAEKTSGVKIKRAFLGISGVDLDSKTADGAIAVSRADSEITDYDVKRAIMASEANLPDIGSQKIIHTYPVYYKIDGKRILGRPAGIRGNKLEVRTLFITCLEQHMDHIVYALENAGVEVEDILAAPIAASFVAVSKRQKAAGCVLANIGSETVSVVVFEEGMPVSLQIFPLGSNDITNDIALGFKIPLDEAESLKIGREDMRYPKKRLDEIIEARLSDIFELIETHLKKIGKAGLLPAGIVVTGGGSYSDEILELARGALRLPAQKAVHPPLRHGGDDENEKPGRTTSGNHIEPSNATGMSQASRYEQELKSPVWSVAYGLCVHGLDETPEESVGVSFARKTKSKIGLWFKQFLP